MARHPPHGWYPQRGEVYLVQIDKHRPALVISADFLNRHALGVGVVPMTTVEHRTFSLRVQIDPGEGGLIRASWAKCDQVTTVETNLLLYPPVGRIANETLESIEASIKLALQLA